MGLLANPPVSDTISNSSSTVDEPITHEGTMLPLCIRQVEHVPYDTTKYNLALRTLNLLEMYDI